MRELEQYLLAVHPEHDTPTLCANAPRLLHRVITPMISLILASGSSSRAKMLQQAGVPFQQIVPKIDESNLKQALLQDGASHRDIADTLAEYKARKISHKHPEALVLGSDQVLEFNGQLISKSETHEELLECLRSMRGKTHTLISAAVIFEDLKPVWRSVKTVRMTMRAPSEAYLKDYIDRNWDQIKWCVGGYQLEGEGARLFADVRGDYFTVLGMPLLDVLSYLTQRGAISG